MSVIPLIKSASGVTPPYKLKLFVTTWSCPCERAIRNLSALLEECFPADYLLEVIDISRDPDAAIKENILCVPFLVKESPQPRICLLGDMSNRAKVLAGLALVSA